MAVPFETPFGPMDAICDWLRANGIDPRDVPIDGPIVIEGRFIRYVALLHDEAGRRYHDPATDRAAREERTAPLKVEPPENVRVRTVDPTAPTRTEPSAEDIACWLKDTTNREAVMTVLRREARVDRPWLVSMLRDEARRNGGQLDWLARP